MSIRYDFVWGCLMGIRLYGYCLSLLLNVCINGHLVGSRKLYVILIVHVEKT